MKRLFVFSLCLFIQTGGFFSYQPSLDWYSVYFLKSNQAYVAAAVDTVWLNGAGLFIPYFNVNYGISDRVEAGFNMSYLIMGGADDGGRLGDLRADLKFLLAQATDLNWRVSAELDFRFPTGVQESDSERTINGFSVSYQPYSSGTAGISTAVSLGLFYLEPFMAGLSVGYASESASDESIFQFNIQRDRVFGQLALDYYLKLENGETDFVFLPCVFLEYQYNLSSQVYIADGLSTGFVWNTRYGDWKNTISISVPIGMKPHIISAACVFGRYF